MLTATQIRMARAALRWSQSDLATHAGLQTSTVTQFEVGASRPLAETVNRIEAALITAGCLFYDDGRTVTSPEPD